MAKAAKRQGFETRLKELEDLVSRLEDGSLPLEESLALLRAAEQRVMVPNALAWLAMVFWARGEQERAFALLEEGLGFSRELGDPWVLSHTLLLLGQWERHRGDYERAKVLTQESLTIRRSMKDRWGIAASLLELACMAAGQGWWERAARLWGAAEALREDLGAIVLPGLQGDPSFVVSSARAGLGEEGFAMAQAAGRAMSLDQAVAYALEATEPRSPASGQQPSPALPPSLLTQREREVAVLIARGRTNQEIAAELVISRRTAEAHAANILRKLSFTSRAQVGAWAVEHGLLRSSEPK